MNKRKLLGYLAAVAGIGSFFLTLGQFSFGGNEVIAQTAGCAVISGSRDISINCATGEGTGFSDENGSSSSDQAGGTSSASPKGAFAARPDHTYGLYVEDGVMCAARIVGGVMEKKCAASD